MSTGESPSPATSYPPGFRARRAVNWLAVGLTYTSFYLCRYNLSISNKAICTEFNLSKEDFGYILTAFFWAYAIGQFVNGLFSDRLGGKRTMLIGTIGTVILNFAFGAASFAGTLSLFVGIRMLDGYLQSFGCPGMVKINTAWFGPTERGRFAGIFGFVIQLGRFIINWLGPALMAGFSILILTVPPLHWRWVFWVPAALTALTAIVLAVFAENTPEEAGWRGVIPVDGADEGSEGPLPVSVVVKTILTNRYVWIVALAYFCTGAVRQGVDQWFPRYLEDCHRIPLKSATFQTVAFLLPMAAVLGSILAGYVSDKLFAGKRAPVAAILYFSETAIILVAAWVTASMYPNGYAHGQSNLGFLGLELPGIWVVCGFLLLISFTANATHSILGTAAAMDIGGRRMSGCAAGVIDSFQYIGGGLSGFGLGKLLDHFGWNAWLASLAGFGVLGGLLMLTIGGKTDLRARARQG